MASRSVNKVILVGHLGKDAETKFTPSGVSVTRFSVATSRRWKDQQSGEWKEETEWTNVSQWRAENFAPYLTKGKQVYVEGRLQTRSYEDKDGQKKYSTEVVADGIDEDCDGGELCFADEDGDRFGSGASVVSLNISCEDAGESVSDADCDDADASIFPGAPETCNAVDDNCDGDVDESLESCTPEDTGDGGDFVLCSCAAASGGSAWLPAALVALALAAARRRRRS